MCCLLYHTASYLHCILFLQNDYVPVEEKSSKEIDTTDTQEAGESKDTRNQLCSHKGQNKMQIFLRATLLVTSNSHILCRPLGHFDSLTLFLYFCRSSASLTHVETPIVIHSAMSFWPSSPSCTLQHSITSCASELQKRLVVSNQVSYLLFHSLVGNLVSRW